MNQLNTRIALKYDSYENWSNVDHEGKGGNFVLLKGEVGLCEIPSQTKTVVDKDGRTVRVETAPTVLLKVGAYKKDADGNDTTELCKFSELPWVSAKAADVYDWAKKSEADFTTWVKSLIDIGDIDLSGYHTKEEVANLLANKSKVDIADKNGYINVDGTDVLVYEHPTHEITDINGLASTLDGKSDKGHAHVVADITDFDSAVKGYDYATKTEAKGYADAKDDAIEAAKQAGLDASSALNTYKGEMVTALAGKQDVIPENTYDTYGSAAQALTDAKAYVDEEDVFEIEMNTVNALGGIGADQDLNGLTTHEILKKLLYPYVDASVGNATATPNGGTYEKGTTKTITQVSISVTKKSEPITSVALYNGSTLLEEKTGDAVKNGGTITFTGLSVEVPTNGNQLTVKVTYPDANGNAKTVEKKTTSLTFVYPYYVGTCAAGTTIDEALVESLTKKVESKGNKSNSFTVSDGHMVFAYPKAHGVLKNIIDPNNFETIGNYTRSEVSITGLDGTAQTYYVYVSGATTVSGFNVNFKY